MKPIFTTSIIFLAFTFMGCKWYVIHQYKMNNSFSFKQKADFIQYINKKKLFKINQVLFIDKASYTKFFNEKLTDDSTLFYVGTYLNDSTMVKRSKFLNENISCSGRIENEIKQNLNKNNFSVDDLKQVSNLSNYTLRYLSNNEIFDINADKKLSKIFITYTYRYGKWYDNLYKEINDLQQLNNQNTNVYLVCLDPISTLP
jgi:hypothetical protein